MQSIVRISSKRQITIPAKIFDQLNLQEGDRLLFNLQEDKIIVQKSQQALDELAGSVKLPEKYKSKSLDFIITDAKSDYFTTKK